jgi:hypothetical protein
VKPHAGEKEGLLRVRDLAVWNLSHSTINAIYLFRHSKAHPEFVEMGRHILRSMEDQLVHNEGHPHTGKVFFLYCFINP